MDKTAENLALGTLIHDLRKHKKLTLSELAERISRSVGFLSQVERGLSRPTMADLTAISEAMDVPTSYFYRTLAPSERPWLTRPAQRPILHLADGISDVMVSPSVSGAFTVLESRLEPGASSGERHLSDRSEQAGYVLEGEITVWLDDDPVGATLHIGDAFQVPSYARLRYANPGSTLARVLWVYT